MELLFLAIGLAIAGYIAFVYFFPKAIPEDETLRTKHALKELMESTQAAESGVNESAGSRNAILRDQFKEESALVQSFYSLPFLNALYTAQVQAGYQRQTPVIMMLLVALVFAFTAFFLFGGFGPMSLVLGVVFAYLVPFKYFRRKVRKRNEQFINLFPDVLDMIVRSVRSGFPITTAFKMVAENMEAPVNQEFQQVVSEISAGRSVNETLTRLSARISEPDISFFAVVLSVQQETGGNLAEVVSNLSHIIRKRKQLRLKIRAMTSEGRATALILGALPVFVFFVLYFMRREYLEPLWQESLGQILLGISISLVLSCMWLVNQMIDIDI